MPKGPKGKKHSRDVIVAAVKVTKIAAGEIDEHQPENDGKDRATRAL